jgi:hypothetical protein
MNKSRFTKFLLFLLFIFAFLVPLGFIVMVLWNNILIPVAHVPAIDFWQAMGLFALSRILFGGFPSKPGWGGHGRRRHVMEEMRNKWFHLSPEEKVQFKQEWKGRFGMGPVSNAPNEAEPE